MRFKIKLVDERGKMLDPVKRAHIQVEVYGIGARMTNPAIGGSPSHFEMNVDEGDISVIVSFRDEEIFKYEGKPMDLTITIPDRILELIK